MVVQHRGLEEIILSFHATEKWPSVIELFRRSYKYRRGLAHFIEIVLLMPPSQTFDFTKHTVTAETYGNTSCKRVFLFYRQSHGAQKYILNIITVVSRMNHVDISDQTNVDFIYTTGCFYYKTFGWQVKKKRFINERRY